jgi:hypothetical protein
VVVGSSPTTQTTVRRASSAWRSCAPPDRGCRKTPDIPTSLAVSGIPPPNPYTHYLKKNQTALRACHVIAQPYRHEPYKNNQPDSLPPSNNWQTSLFKNPRHHHLGQTKYRTQNKNAGDHPVPRAHIMNHQSSGSRKRAHTLHLPRHKLYPEVKETTTQPN